MKTRTSPQPLATDALLLAVVLTAVGILTAFALHSRWPVLPELSTNTSWHGALLWGAHVLAGLGAGMLLLRLLLWLGYRPAAPATPDRAPMLSVIIPAYNEGAMVARSIDSVAAARYPRQRLQIIAIDDGSRDDTREHMRRAARRHPGLVDVIEFEHNRGKRAALGAGFERARGEIVVTVDSDSEIEPDTLLELAGAFADPRVGAVAGRVAVLNRFAGLIPRMLHVRYAIAFDFERAAQSRCGIVYCCPGALAAYRVAALRPVLSRWLEQTFLGAPCTIGEDRALTNFVLGQGWRSVYQRNAVVHTLAPTRYRGLCKMFLRWDRSHVRETCHLARLLGRLRPAQAGLATLDLLLSSGGIALGYALGALMVHASFHHVATLGWIGLGVALAGALNAAYFRRCEPSRDWVFGIVFAFYTTLTMFWILPYAMLTVRARGWLTR